MDEKISLDAITSYGHRYAEKILKDFFSGKNKIRGSEILSLCNVHQINLFVIRDLFKAWKEETKKLKSSYFDNDHAEVKEALSTYMGVVSNHILVDEVHFSPLLKKATVETLMMIFNPYDFFSILVAGKKDALEVNSFREEIKYIKINKAPLERMLKKLDEQGVNEIEGNEAFAILDHILEEVGFTPEDVEEYINKFSSVIPLDPALFYVNSPARELPQETSSAKAIQHNQTFNERPADKIQLQETRAIESTINERLNQVKQPAVADTYRKISKIKDNLTINQKFMFTKVLFYGDFESFSRAIDDLDQVPDMNTALQYLEKHSSAWDRESKEFHEFMELVEKRFA